MQLNTALTIERSETGKGGENIFRGGTTVGTINAKNGNKEKHLRGATDIEVGCKWGEEKRHY